MKLWQQANCPSKLASTDFIVMVMFVLSWCAHG